MSGLGSSSGGGSTSPAERHTRPVRRERHVCAARRAHGRVDAGNGESGGALLPAVQRAHPRPERRHPKDSLRAHGHSVDADGYSSGAVVVSTRPVELVQSDRDEAGRTGRAAAACRHRLRFRPLRRERARHAYELDGVRAGRDPRHRPEAARARHAPADGDGRTRVALWVERLVRRRRTRRRRHSSGRFPSRRHLLGRLAKRPDRVVGDALARALLLAPAPEHLRSHSHSRREARRTRQLRPATIPQASRNPPTDRCPGRHPRHLRLPGSR